MNSINTEGRSYPTEDYGAGAPEHAQLDLLSTELQKEINRLDGKSTLIKYYTLAAAIFIGAIGVFLRIIPLPERSDDLLDWYAGLMSNHSLIAVALLVFGSWFILEARIIARRNSTQNELDIILYRKRISGRLSPP